MLQNALILRIGPQTRRSSSHCSIWRLTLAEQTVKNNETVLVISRLSPTSGLMSALPLITDSKRRWSDVS